MRLTSEISVDFPGGAAYTFVVSAMILRFMGLAETPGGLGRFPASLSLSGDCFQRIIKKMAKVSKHALVYLRFLNLVEAIRELPNFPAIDSLEERMLNVLAANWHEGRQISVLEAMRMLPDISATTAHRRLKALRTKGMIALNTDPSDSRIKYVVPTELASNYFGRMGTCLDKALEA